VKASAWYYKLPGAVYAYGPMRFSQPVTERRARAAIRFVWELARLPRGTEVWPTT
jgi:hypothetical protein